MARQIILRVLFPHCVLCPINTSHEVWTAECASVVPRSGVSFCASGGSSCSHAPVGPGTRLVRYLQNRLNGVYAALPFCARFCRDRVTVLTVFDCWPFSALGRDRDRGALVIQLLCTGYAHSCPQSVW
jgi:hypothetical protein